MGCGASVPSASTTALLARVYPDVVVESNADAKGNPHGIGAAAVMRVDGSCMYVVGNKGLAVLNVSDLSSPFKDGNIIDTKALGYDGGAAVILCQLQGSKEEQEEDEEDEEEAEGFLYIAGAKGLAVLELINKMEPTCVGNVIETQAISPTGGVAAALSSNHAHMYLAGGKGLAVVDLSNLRKPSIVGSVIETDALSLEGGVALTVFDDDKLLYLAGGNGLAVFDLQDPAEPVQMSDVVETGALAFKGGAAMEAHGQVLYIAGGGGLAVFDIADKLQPSQISEVQDTGNDTLKWEITVMCLFIQKISGGKRLGSIS
eukprot:gnl/TRDRNA2_/TRDRNA2_140333_c0_seq1.p1 gnl/TRDRNA2_/TRDRNA2_140333_c0~~gnl/TRDRNA2_/TRDRNA2_140333_c0_seq1.p1  ORF type:complete len:316 (-),score=67.58 gnl/TRDRNA2_/TRDRNA2_140333_c0_seq1:77-1024(-)